MVLLVSLVVLLAASAELIDVSPSARCRLLSLPKNSLPAEWLDANTWRFSLGGIHVCVVSNTRAQIGSGKDEDSSPSEYAPS